MISNINKGKDISKNKQKPSNAGTDNFKTKEKAVKVISDDNSAFYLIICSLFSKKKITLLNVNKSKKILDLLNDIKLLGVVYNFDYTKKILTIKANKFKITPAILGGLKNLDFLITVFLFRINILRFQINTYEYVSNSANVEFLKNFNLNFKKDKNEIVLDKSKIKADYIYVNANKSEEILNLPELFNHDNRKTSNTGNINLTFVSIITSIFIKGKTTIYNANYSLVIQDVCHFLNKIGAKISGIQTNKLIIKGVNSFTGTKYRIVDDISHLENLIEISYKNKYYYTIIHSLTPRFLIPIQQKYEKLGIKLFTKKSKRNNKWETKIDFVR